MNTLLSRVAGTSLSALTISALMLGTFGISFLQAVPVYAADAVTTVAASNVTATDATLNGTNGPADASGHSFWVSLSSSIDTSSSNIPAGVYSTVDLGPITAGTAFSASLSSVTGLPAVTANTPYYFVAWSDVGGTWYPGAVIPFTTAAATPCAVVGTPFLTITQNISNDADSGVHGDWAKDAFTENVKVWKDSDDRHCATANTTNGTFVTTGPNFLNKGLHSRQELPAPSPVEKRMFSRRWHSARATLRALRALRKRPRFRIVRQQDSLIGHLKSLRALLRGQAQVTSTRIH